MSGAELQRVRRELALELIKTGQPSLSQAGVVEMINVVKYGVRQSAETSRSILERTAYHEAGHAVVSMTLCPERKIEQSPSFRAPEPAALSPSSRTMHASR